MPTRRFIAVLGHGSLLERQGGTVAILRQLGADVRTLNLRQNPIELIRDDDPPDLRARVLIFEALDRPDLGVRALRAARKEPYFDTVGTLIAVAAGHIVHIERSSGFDDFIRFPYAPAELYCRIRALEWRRKEIVPESKYASGRLIIDRESHDVYVDGSPVVLTAKEFDLLAYLCERRGKVLSRQHLLDRIWGERYDGNPRTVDVHVARLRAKLGDALPIKTLRGRGGRQGGYLLRALKAHTDNCRRPRPG